MCNSILTLCLKYLAKYKYQKLKIERLVKGMLGNVNKESIKVKALKGTVMTVPF